jgi:hypothetical protein
MADTQNNQNQQPNKEDFQIEPISDQALEDVSGGTCPIASCSDALCSTSVASV